MRRSRIGEAAGGRRGQINKTDLKKAGGPRAGRAPRAAGRVSLSKSRIIKGQLERSRERAGKQKYLLPFKAAKEALCKCTLPLQTASACIFQARRWP